MRTLLALLMLPMLGAGARALPRQIADTPSAAAFPGIEFSYAPQDPAATGWRIRIFPQALGFFQANGAEEVQPLALTPAIMQQLVKGEAAVHSESCQSKRKRIASTGTTTLVYKQDGGSTSCTFRYTDDLGLNETANTFQSLAETIQIGERLKHDHRFGKLALDADMDQLAAELSSGHAIEVDNIAPVLRSIAADDSVMDRVRRKAQQMLDQSADAAALSAR